MPVLPALAQLDPVYDEHAWHFPNVNLHRAHVRLRVWPTVAGGHLVVTTDFMLGGGLVNMAESLVRACVREFGDGMSVVRLPRRRRGHRRRGGGGGAAERADGPDAGGGPAAEAEHPRHGRRP
ncbi:hypothetical protein [Streptomyces triculaminicus]|uniref:hypothetical protein n=1 Tax=Streptomyces triculaminicus TaxID=2816232 RepID=UPI0037D5C736